MVSRSEPKIIVIVGPTASGKSNLSMQLAEKYNGEIISADPYAARIGMDIGSAKPSLEDQANVKHHLIDVAQPNEEFSVADFKAMAEEEISDISSRNKLPIVVGGSGLYIDSLLYNYSFRPKPDMILRKKLAGLDLSELTDYVKDLNLDINQSDSKNPRRLARLIESGGVTPEKLDLRPNILLLGITIENEVLKTLIDKRVDYMFKSGLAEEVVKLKEKYGFEALGMQGIGYKEWENYFMNKLSVDDTKQLIIKNTYYLAKKQRTWFKRNKDIHWLDYPIDIRSVYQLTDNFLGH